MVQKLTDAQTDRQAESNMPFQLFQSWGHKKHLRHPYKNQTSSPVHFDRH